jgi:hypothetical protein
MLLKPPYQRGGQADRSQIISRQPIVARRDAPEILQSAEGILDAPTKLVEILVEAERFLLIAAIRNDRLGSTFMQPVAQFGAIVGLVTEHVSRLLRSADESLRDGAVVYFTSGQQDIPRTSLGKCGSIRNHCSSLSQNRCPLMYFSHDPNHLAIV